MIDTGARGERRGKKPPDAIVLMEVLEFFQNKYDERKETESFEEEDVFAHFFNPSRPLIDQIRWSLSILWKQGLITKSEDRFRYNPPLELLEEEDMLYGFIYGVSDLKVKEG